MRQLIKGEIAYFKTLTIRERVILIYFLLSFVTLFAGDETPILTLLIIVANFGNSVRLLRTIPEPPEDDEPEFD